MGPLTEQRTTTLRRRLEASALIALFSVGAFAFADSLAGVTSRPLLLVHLAQVILSAVTLVLSRRARTWPGVANGSVAFICLLTTSAVATAILRHDTQSLPVLLTMIVLITATFSMWGFRRQMVLAAVALAGLVANLAGLGILAAAVPYPLLPVVLALAVSVWIAGEADRHARDRHRAETALRESEERFRTLAQHAPVPIWMSDAAGDLTYLNPAWGDLVAVGPTPSRTFWRSVHRTDRQTLLAAARAAVEAREPYQGECRVVAPDGRTRWLAVRGVPRFASDGSYEGHIGTAVDVTETKAEARDLAAARNAAVEAARLKSSFLATMSHEIRTPMHGIFGMTELALDTEEPDERREFILRARSCAKTLMTLLDEILDLSRIEEGRLELARETVDLGEVVQNAVDTVAMAADQKGLEIVVEFAPDVPTSVGGDAARLRQILTNLLANAVKFTEVGEIDLRVAIASGALSVSIRDTGVGIRPEAIDTIFDPFTQGDRTVGQRFGGTGLGLAISRRLAEAMGGTIAVESVVGRGATFVVTLPIVAPVGPTMVEEFGAVEGMSVLLVASTPLVGAALRRFLQRFGCTVATIGAGDQRPPLGVRADVVLADVDANGPDGIPVAERLDALSAATAGAELILLCPLRPGARAGADATRLVVTKPVQPSTLLRALLAARRSLAATGS